MTSIWTLGIPILIADVANPVLLAAVILCLTTESPYRTSIALIVGHFVSYLCFGLLIIFGLADLFLGLFAPLIDAYQNPMPFDFVISFVIGILLIVVAWRWKISPPDPAEKHPEKAQAGLLQAFGFGAIINFAGIPFALPYVAFINQLLPLEDSDKIFALIIYNILYALPFLLLPLALALLGKAILPTLDRINVFVEKYSAYLIPAILGVLGLVMVLDAVLFFATGEGLL